jgi:hypothetical protein
MSLGDQRRNLPITVTMEYKDSPELKITDYFDIPHNSWSNEGVKAALNRAVGMCKKL